MRFNYYIKVAVKLIADYKGEIPFSHYAKAYFALNKKHGSKDRKYITHACYCYFRACNGITNTNLLEAVTLAIFLCTDNAKEWQDVFDATWLNEVDANFEQRINFLSKNASLQVNQIFKWQPFLSAGINNKDFNLAHLRQPYLFLRIRPNKEKIVLQKLTAANIFFQTFSNNCLAITNATNIQQVVIFNKEVVVQDYSSQQVSSLLAIVKQYWHNKAAIKVWDCCAASGGKSILAKDILGNIQLTVTDIRASILHNLKKRFLEAGINYMDAFVADLTKDNARIHATQYNLIICDVPCTGSGTWSRNPESLLFFNVSQIETFTTKQKTITVNAAKHLANGGYLLYITCSVFKQENEMVINDVQAQTGLQCIAMQVFTGYEHGADTMFAALLQKL